VRVISFILRRRRRKEEEEEEKKSIHSTNPTTSYFV
jgi:hypothetical protein